MSERDETVSDSAASRDDKGGVDARLLEILVCPLTKGPLRYDRERQELISDQAGLAYPIRDGIPIMLVEEATPIEGSFLKDPPRPT